MAEQTKACPCGAERSSGDPVIIKRWISDGKTTKAFRLGGGIVFEGNVRACARCGSLYAELGAIEAYSSESQL